MYACYCRVSSRRQKNDSQRAEIQRWLTNRRIRKPSIRWHGDRESGRSLRRPAFEGLQRATFAGEVDTAVVWKLDRISRPQRGGVGLLADWCGRGIRVVVVTQQIDLGGAAGRMVASVLFGLAEIEAEYRRGRQAAGIAVAERRGAYHGRQEGTTEAKPSRARQPRDQGMSVAEMANALAVSDRAVFRYLAEGAPSSV